MTAHILPWLRALAATAEVWVADPGRAYLPRAGSRRSRAIAVPTTHANWRTAPSATVTLYRLLPAG